jgi:hypothetical protein
LRSIEDEEVKKQHLAGHQWLTPVILATQEAEIKRITVQSQLGEIAHKRPYLKTPLTKKELVEWL